MRALIRNWARLRQCSMIGCITLLAATASSAQVFTPPSIDPSQLMPPAPGTTNQGMAAASPALQQLYAQADRPRRGTEAAAQRDAHWLLGLLALHGLGMPLDPPAARSRFQAAQRLGHPLAPAGLAWCAIDGCGQAPNPPTARPWIAQLRKADPARALYMDWLVASRLAPIRLGPSHGDPNQPPPANSTVPERSLLQQAARAGSPQAQLELGLAEVAQSQYQAAYGYFRNAAPRSPAAAANAQLIQDRYGTSASSRESARAPATGTSQSWLEMARRYHRGDGVPANYTEAIRLYQQAAASENQEAKRMLELIYSRPAPGGGIDIAWMQQLARMDVSRPHYSVSGLGGAQPFQRDPTPLYDLVPAEWRKTALH